MKHLEQSRATSALAATEGKTGPDKGSVSKLPAMILANGLLATIAFSCEKSKDGQKRPDMALAIDGLARHLAKTELGFTELQPGGDGPSLGTKLARSSPMTLHRATGEALAYLAFLKRYAEKKDKAAGADRD